MGRVFWQFFLAIWLTILGAIAIIVVTNSWLKVLPPKAEGMEFHERMALDVISDMIKRGAIDSAKDYIVTLSGLRHPTKMAMTQLAPKRDAEDCRVFRERYRQQFDPTTGRCYAISVMDAPPTLLQVYLPPLLPPLAALLMSTISAFLVARYLVRPVMTVRAGLNALANGNFAIRIGSTFRWWRDEITALGHDFDATADKLEQLQASQRRLFHDVSHELRSPLSRMQAAFGLLKQNPTKLPVLMPRMEREIERIDGLVEEILTLARMGSPAAQNVQLQSLDVIDLLTAVIDDATFEAQSRDITIAYSGIGSFVSHVSGELLYRAFENVLRNAVKYSNWRSTITVETAQPVGDNLSIVICNDGVFVSPDDVPKMFEPFTRLLENETKIGHGLGLSITRHAMEFHGGRVSAESRPGGGLTVTMIMPLSAG
jgi:signal transduction histidine kinase